MYFWYKSSINTAPYQENALRKAKKGIKRKREKKKIQKNKKSCRKRTDSFLVVEKRKNYRL